MSRDGKRLLFLAAAGAVFVWWGYDKWKPQPPDPAGPSMRAYLNAPDMGITCFDDHGQLIGWQWVAPSDAKRLCNVSPERLIELRSTDWQAVAAEKRQTDFSRALLFGGLSWLVLGFWLWRIERGDSAAIRVMTTMRAHYIRRRRSDRLWLLAWLLAIPAVFLLPELPRDALVTCIGIAGAVWLFLVLPVKALVNWLQDRADEREEKLASATRRDTRPHLATGRPVTRADEEERLGL